jgi:predicted phospho-2-dehydro-3-deoxyheptonate aldolase
MSVDKSLRMRRLFNLLTNKTVLYPIDHGVTMGPIEGIENIRAAVGAALGEPVDGVILHKGAIVRCLDTLSVDRNMAVIMHVSASVSLSPHVNEKVLVGSVEEAVRLGCDGVSVHVNLGPRHDTRMLRDFGKVSRDCVKYGMPLLAMMYCRTEAGDELSESGNRIAARAAMELGADIIKVNYTGSPRSFERVVAGCDVPVIVAGGGATATLLEFLEKIEGAMQAGASGVAVGRNVFQHRQPRLLLRGLAHLIHSQMPAKQVAELIEGELNDERPAEVVHGDRGTGTNHRTTAAVA